ncbi:MAG TPA: cupredoxin domain-containing protein [Thermomicrobiales bacterium]|nr:cupredoxin domain-containing protein [Thermomicrobiales bacterium]
MGRHRAFHLVLIVLTLVAIPSPATAGGWATVRLDVPLGVIETGEPLRIGFMVMQHDTRPFAGAEARLGATNTANGDEARANAVEEGPEGHYVVEVAFNTPGTWTWEIAPDPFAPTSLPPLTVVDKRPTPASIEASRPPDTKTAHAAAIHAGSCDRLDDQAELPLSDVVASSPDTPAIPFIKESRTTLDIELSQLLTRLRAIAIHSERDDALIACGDISGNMASGRLTIGLREEAGSGYAGIAELTSDGDQTGVTVYLAHGLMAPPRGVQPEAATGPRVEIRMAGSTFSPSKAEISPGTTVIWINDDAVTHEVSSDAPTFADSGVIDPGDSISQTFTEPGTIAYQCAFHAGMAGTIIVT